MKDLSQTYSFEHTALISKQFSGLKSTERECRQKQNKNKPPLKKKGDKLLHTPQSWKADLAWSVCKS